MSDMNPYRAQWDNYAKNCNRSILKYERKGLGYSSDLSDAEWTMVEPRLSHRNRLGRPPKTEMRSVVNALLYMV